MSTALKNRISIGILLYQKRIDKNEKGATKADLEKLHKELDLTVMERAAFFETNSKAFAMGRLSLDESQLIYNIVKDWENADLATRITVTQVIKELLSR